MEWKPNELQHCHPQDKKLSQSHSEYHYLGRVSVLPREEVFGFRVKREGMPNLCPATRGLPYVSCAVTLPELCRGIASPDVKAQ